MAETQVLQNVLRDERWLPRVPELGIMVVFGASGGLTARKLELHPCSPGPCPAGAVHLRSPQIRPDPWAPNRACILVDAEDEGPEVLLLGTDSEVHLCVDAYEQLKSEGIKVRVVSVPSWEFFEQQSEEYRESVIPSTSRRASR